MGKVPSELLLISSLSTPFIYFLSFTFPPSTFPLLPTSDLTSDTISIKLLPLFPIFKLSGDLWYKIESIISRAHCSLSSLECGVWFSYFWWCHEHSQNPDANESVWTLTWVSSAPPQPGASLAPPAETDPVLAPVFLTFSLCFSSCFISLIGSLRKPVLILVILDSVKKIKIYVIWGFTST